MTEFEEVYEWVDKVPLTRVRKHFGRDFSDGCLTAEVIKHYWPEVVDLHNYQEALGATRKRENWVTLNHKILKKHLKINLTKSQIEDLCNTVKGAAEKVLVQIKKKLETKKDLSIEPPQLHAGHRRAHDEREREEAPHRPHREAPARAPARGVPESRIPKYGEKRGGGEREEKRQKSKSPQRGGGAQSEEEEEEREEWRASKEKRGVFAQQRIWEEPHAKGGALHPKMGAVAPGMEAMLLQLANQNLTNFDLQFNDRKRDLDLREQQLREQEQEQERGREARNRERHAERGRDRSTERDRERERHRDRDREREKLPPRGAKHVSPGKSRLPAVANVLKPAPHVPRGPKPKDRYGSPTKGRVGDPSPRGVAPRRAPSAGGARDSGLPMVPKKRIAWPEERGGGREGEREEDQGLVEESAIAVEEVRSAYSALELAVAQLEEEARRRGALLAARPGDRKSVV